MYLQIIQDYLYQNFGPKINIVFKQKSGNTKMNEMLLIYWMGWNSSLNLLRKD